jgi:uncharacterized membrane protein
MDPEHGPGPVPAGGWTKSLPGHAPLLFLAAGLVLSLLDWAGVCTEACAETSLYRFFGLPIPPLGAAYFTLAGAARLAGRRHRPSRAALAVLLAGGLGAEAVFTWIQAAVIGRWCPICVGVAACIAACSAFIAFEHFSRADAILLGKEREPSMKRSALHPALLLLAFLAGLGTAALGIKKPDALASGLTPETISFGAAGSGVEVYIVSDWFCPACRIAEPEIVKGARLAMKQAKVVFVDYPIHRETLNYIPYNLSFMSREKEKYLQIREALADLSRKSKDPSPEDVQAAVAPFGVKYVPLSFADVLSGTQYQMSIVQKYKVQGTPQVVVTETRTGRTKMLNGSKEITAENIVRAVAEVSGK